MIYHDLLVTRGSSRGPDHWWKHPPNGGHVETEGKSKAGYGTEAGQPERWSSGPQAPALAVGTDTGTHTCTCVHTRHAYTQDMHAHMLIYTHTYVHGHVCTHHPQVTRIYTQTHACTMNHNTHVHVQTCTQAYAHVYTQAYTHAHRHACAQPSQ